MINKKRKGFTLIEVLIVIAIIGVLAAIAIPRFVLTSNDAKIRSCDANTANINTQWEIQNIKDGSFTTPLSALLSDTDYFPDGAPTCPFGTAYVDADGDNRVDAHSH